MICAKVILVGFLAILTPTDKAIIKSSAKRCKEVYKSCPGKLIKIEEHVYNVLCGEELND